MAEQGPHPHLERSSDDAALVARLRTGDEQALAALIRAYFTRVARFSYNLLGSYDAAQDVAQDVFVRLWEQRETLDPARGIKPYLFTLAKRHALNDLKYQRVRDRYQARTQDEATHDVTVGHASSGEDTILTVTTVQAALSELPERRQIAVRLRIEEQLSHVEIARVLELSPQAAERLVQRGLEELRRLLRNRGVSGLTPPEL